MFTKKGRQRRASYASIGQQIIDAWTKVSASTVARALKHVGIGTDQSSNSNETDSGEDVSMPDASVAQLINSDTEDEEFDGFVEEE